MQGLHGVGVQGLGGRVELQTRREGTQAITRKTANATQRVCGSGFRGYWQPDAWRTSYRRCRGGWCGARRGTLRGTRLPCAACSTCPARGRLAFSVQNLACRVQVLTPLLCGETQSSAITDSLAGCLAVNQWLTSQTRFPCRSRPPTLPGLLKVVLCNQIAPLSSESFQLPQP